MLETAKNAFTRHHLETMERSYRTLAQRTLRKSGRLAEALDRLEGRQPEPAGLRLLRGSIKLRRLLKKSIPSWGGTLFAN
ncbi:hypothetical protein [Bradyrhizobium sp. CSS354]|uniref:hypothetical protein n=1 Tax=Bradyrhizobium sp. CSS354 TaxID=2699172 RepID=UPI0023B1314E|nr:hypothetical protein [Bradyrhizobium sp. CSS354]MDE5461571.1 hypothetical protein [Bradyrhizobium sp. CSS354]